MEWWRRGLVRRRQLDRHLVGCGVVIEHRRMWCLRSIDRLSSAGGQPLATPHTESSNATDAPVTESRVVGDGGVPGIATVSGGDDQKIKLTRVPSTARPQHGKEMAGEPGGALADPNNGNFNNEAKKLKDSEADRTETTEKVVDASGAGVPPDVMLSDAPAPPGVAGRTPEGELVSDDRTSGSEDSVDSEKEMADLSDDMRNLMKETISSVSLSQPNSRSPAAPHARESSEPDLANDYEGSADEMVRISGLRVEAHGKGIEYEELAGSVLVNTEATLRLFGQVLTTDTEILFTANPAEAGEVCGAHLSKAFKSRTDGPHCVPRFLHRYLC
ncbi:hypothetical protein E2C01_026799 [Portunus trituberculatus]|uniref:Uncharacterized protein n=1 Tax=Portunus trituberculatus TaxID=210409 RepID=A0A5B7EJY2_PORTR|nr:hypothetical protein [Portunus trituberculatus]